MKKEINLFIAMLTLLLVGSMVFAGESRYASGTTSAAVTFGPQSSQSVIKSLYATTDKAGGTAKLYAWDQVATLTPTAAPTNGATVIAVANSAGALTTNDMVVYVHDTGTVEYRTISASSTNSVTISSALTEAGTTGDRIYELAQVAQLDFDSSGAGVGTNKYGSFSGDAVYVSPGGSPIYAVVDGTSNSVVNVTRD